MYCLQLFISPIIQFVEILIRSIIQQRQLRRLYYANSYQKAIKVVSTTNKRFDVIHVIQEFDRVTFNGFL